MPVRRRLSVDGERSQICEPWRERLNGLAVTVDRELMLACGFANLQMSPRSDDHLLKVRMHDRLAERHQLQRLDELLARDVLTEEATSTCLKRGKDVIRGVRPGEDNHTQTWICRIYPPYQVVCGPPTFVHPDEPNTDRSRHQKILSVVVERRQDLDWSKVGFSQDLTESVADEGTRMSHYKRGYATHCTYSTCSTREQLLQNNVSLR